jgi:tRNA (cytidine/uridine-2'-O-)-methyltransferase
MTLHVALVEPQIPPNTGNVARLCAATGTALHVVEPLGFSLDDREVRRAGLDYWDAVELWVHPSFQAFRAAIAETRCLYFSTHGRREFWSAPFQANSVLVFGNETAGLPEWVRLEHPERVFRIPMTGDVRSLNLATAAGIVVYEAIRQRAIGGDPLPGARVQPTG